MTVLITGAGGQLGKDLLDAFAEHHPVGRTRAQLDVGDEAAVWAAVEELRPAIVINAAAWTDVDGCEGDPARAHRANALGPWWLARACRALGGTLVTVSTDYVFDGDAPTGPDGHRRGWSEFDALAPINAYGRSKAAGEQLVRETLPDHHIVRTAWVAGARGGNFVRTMLRVGRERGRVAVVDDQHGSPTFTRDLADAIRRLVVSGRHGTVNITNQGWCSWFELAAATFELADLDVELTPQPSSALDRPAPRPAWSVLEGTHAEAMGIGPLPHWREGLRALLRELDASTS